VLVLVLVLDLGLVLVLGKPGLKPDQQQRDEGTCRREHEPTLGSRREAKTKEET
jgi:hypothetical protein